jgi:hypothetical protein
MSTQPITNHHERINSKSFFKDLIRVQIPNESHQFLHTLLLVTTTQKTAVHWISLLIPVPVHNRNPQTSVHTLECHGTSSLIRHLAPASPPSARQASSRHGPWNQPRPQTRACCQYADGCPRQWGVRRARDWSLRSSWDSKPLAGVVAALVGVPAAARQGENLQSVIHVMGSRFVNQSRHARPRPRPRPRQFCVQHERTMNTNAQECT